MDDIIYKVFFSEIYLKREFAMIRKKTSNKLNKKIQIFIFILTLIGYLGVGIYSYLTYKNGLTNSFTSSALTMSNMATSQINGDEVQKYDATGEKDDYYDNLVQSLSDYKKDTGAKFIYIMADTGSGFKYIADGYVEGQSDDQSKLGDTDGYDSYGPEPQEVLKTGVPEASSIYFTDEEYGDLMSAFSPIKNSKGDIVAVLGVDIDPQDIFNELNNYLIFLVLILLASESVTFILMSLIIRKLVTKRVKRLTTVAQGISQGNMDFKLEVKSSKDELDELERSFQGTLRAVKGLVADVNMLVDETLEGRLKTRAETSKHDGDYRKIIEGINATLDAVIAPVNEAAQVLSKVAEGNLNVQVTGDFKGDHSIIKDALNNTIITLKGYIGEISEVLHEISDGVLSGNITSKYNGDFLRLKDSINNIVDSLNKLMREIHNASEQVASGTKQLSDGSQAISRGATEQASAIEELTATITQIATQTRQNAYSANKANELSESVRNGAAQGNEKMKNMQKAMEDINESSANISKIIRVIDDIAFQTNILALNAAVEAARAGIHGKGFAVVAEEVRNLASKSAQAAKETTSLIEVSIEKTGAGTIIANETAEALKNIVIGVEEAGQLIEQIATASNEQAIGIEQVNKGIEQLSKVVQTNSATVQEAAAANEELSSQAELLKGMVERFRLKE